MFSLHTFICLLTLILVVEGKSREIPSEKLLQEVTGLFWFLFEFIFLLCSTPSGLTNRLSSIRPRGYESILCSTRV